MTKSELFSEHPVRIEFFYCFYNWQVRSGVGIFFLLLHNPAFCNFSYWPTTPNVSTVTDSSNNATLTDWLKIEQALSTREFVAKIYRRWVFFSTAANLSQFPHQCNVLINLSWKAIYFLWNKTTRILNLKVSEVNINDNDWMRSSDMHVDLNLRQLISQAHFQVLNN